MVNYLFQYEVKMGGKQKLLIFVFSLLLLFQVQAFSIDQEIKGLVTIKKTVFYVMEDSKGNYQIGSMSLDGTNKKILTKISNNWCPTVDPSGKKIAFFTDRSGFSNLWLMNTDGSQQIPLTENAEDIIKIDLYNRGQLGWIKDGTEILCLRHGDIWSIDQDGGSPSAITKYHDVTSFRVSPDNTKIIFSRERTKNNNGLWAIKSDLTETIQIAPSTIIYPAFDWGDNNTLLYFDNRWIIQIASTGLNKTNIISSDYPINDIVWSRGSKNIKDNYFAYINVDTEAKTPVPNIFMVKNDGKKPIQMTTNGGSSPYFTNDGLYLIYVEDNDIYETELKTMQKKRLTYFFKSFCPVAADVQEINPKETPASPSSGAVNEE
jgi:Tol biopolymer transport system component